MKSTYTKISCENIDDILGNFNITKVKYNSLLLERWLDIELGAENILTPTQTVIFQDVLDLLNADVEGWNEEELKMKALSLIFYIAKMEDMPHIKMFYERPIHAVIDTFLIDVKVDAMLATPWGKATPHHPYFFLQEFKQEKKKSLDPEAQMLAAMLAAQVLNKNDKPLFGGYIIGRSWFFGVLEGKIYTISNAFNATEKEDLHKIIFILRHLKTIISAQLRD
ncbi:MAG: hypothetical protein U5L45_25090 [Saprospiraceae bacterium]|nr:hypothetical protein [Saprospiraceae bacterium]